MNTISHYKPSGYTSVAPYLIVDDAEQTLSFVKAVFGAEPLRVIRNNDGSIVHGEARIDDTVIMVGQMAGAGGAHIHVYLEDIEGAFNRAVDAGGAIVEELTLKDDGDRRGGVRDQGGTTWWLGRQER